MKRIVLITVLALMRVTSFAQNQEIFEGGGADAHARSLTVNGSITFPQINNAGGPTAITDQQAWFNGMLTCTSASPTTVRVYYGTTDGGGDSGAWDDFIDLGASVEGLNLSTNATLNSSTIYFYRYYATNSNGDAWSWPAASFKTFGQPVVDNNGGANPISSTYATLNGRITSGGNSQVYVYFGQDTNNWSATNDFGVIGETAFSTNMTGLTKGTLYYYRCYATNAYGTDWSSTTYFTTGSDAIYVGGSGDEYDGVSEMTIAMKVKRGTVFMISQLGKLFTFWI